jgi:hypothetical protein
MYVFIAAQSLIKNVLIRSEISDRQPVVDRYKYRYETFNSYRINDFRKCTEIAEYGLLQNFRELSIY